MRAVVESDLGAPLGRPLVEIGMIGRKTVNVLLMTRLAGVVAHQGEVVRSAVMFAMTSCAGEFLRGVEASAD